jgi:hypothetical protein
MKILNFFLFLWITFALLDPNPDPMAKINADPQPGKKKFQPAPDLQP